MRAVDTNVLVRLLTRDNPKQAAVADAFVQPGAWVSVLALAEARAVEVLLNHQCLTLPEPEAMAAALETFRQRPGPGFSDCLLVELARKAGHLPLGTFDRDLSKLDGATRL